MTPPNHARRGAAMKLFQSGFGVFSWVKCFVCWLLLAQWGTAQNVPWLIDTIAQSVPSTTTTPTYVDTATQGNANFKMMRGLPVFGGDLFTCGLFYSYRVFDNVRVYTPKGEPILSFSSDTVGIGFAIIKSIGSDLFV